MLVLFGSLFGGFGGGGGGGFGPTPLTSGMSFFADGGRPPLGEVSIVGERGPELFVPSSPGTIVSNEQSRAQLDMYSPRQCSRRTSRPDECQHELQRTNDGIRRQALPAR